MYLVAISTIVMIQEIALLVLLMNVPVRSEAGGKKVARYTNLWAVKLSKNEDGVLEKLRTFEGFEVVQQEHQIPNLHLLIHKRQPRKGRYENTKLTNILFNYKGVLWAEQIYLKQTHLESVSCPGKSVSRPSYYKNILNDTHFHSQWYLQDCRKSNSHTQYDLNVVPVWHHYKYFGYGIKVVVVDTGTHTDHSDLRNNYDPEYGYDFVEYDHSPTPKDFLGLSTHGTNTAGIIAMEANNKTCGVGIAPLVTLGALRVKASHEPETYYQLAAALSFRANDLDVSNNSYGDSTDGKCLNSLNHMIRDALKRGIIKGRRSKGLIFVFAAGNGKPNGDTCAHDTYTGSMYTITVAAVKHDGSVTKYSERCSNILVTAYSGDNNVLPGSGIVSTTSRNRCQTNFSGTSAAAPLVSGITALILESNPELCWRQVQHVFAWTSQVAPLAHNKTWSRNKAGFYFSLDFGFGLADALEAVKFAKTMRPIPSMNSCVLTKTINNGFFDRQHALRIKISTKGCKYLPSEVNYMEHVQLMVNVEHQRRGAIQILLISPSGTKTTLMESRRLDTSTSGLRRHIMDTVQLWGEPSHGVWSIIFYDTLSQSSHRGLVTRVHLLIHGTKDRPPHYITTRTYKKFNLIRK